MPPRIELARTPTPLRPMARAAAALGVRELFVKRDDLTGSTLSGNKVRKLELLLAAARAEGADTVVTCGGEQSNHCRATAIAAAELGMSSVLMLRTEDPGRPPATEANILLDRVVGAEIRWVSREEYRRRAEIFDEIARSLRARGQKPYVIPEGGSNALGSWGYVGCIDELASQLGPEPATIVYATGSGGTGAGLLLGAKLRKLPWRIVGVNVCDDREYFVGVIGAIVEEAIGRWAPGLAFSRDEIEILDGFVGRGYAKTRPEELAALRDLARLEGVVLDPVYTGKAWFGLRSELERNPRAFGDRVVFVHTGGLPGLLAKAGELAPLL
jgi:D-cysteine desulfhydrase